MPEPKPKVTWEEIKAQITARKAEKEKRKSSALAIYLAIGAFVILVVIPVGCVAIGAHLIEIGRRPRIVQPDSRSEASSDSREKSSNIEESADFQRCVVLLVKVDNYSFDRASQICRDKRPANEALD